MDEMLGTAGVLTVLIWTHPANRGHQLRALAKFVGWQLYKRAINRPIDIEAFGLKFRCYPDSLDASSMIYFNTLPDPHEMEFMRRYLRPRDRVVDAGANVGVYTLNLASLVGPSGFVLSFEPDQKNAARLRENIEINGLRNIQVREAALSNYRGFAQFSQGADVGNTFYELRTYGRPPKTVAVTTLEQEMGTQRYALCKMDIEGAELEALDGAGAALSNIPVFIIELSDKILARSQRTIADAHNWFARHRYSLWRFAGESLVPFTDSPRKPGHVGDAIAIADNAMDFVKGRIDQRSIKALETTDSTETPSDQPRVPAL